MQEIKMKVNFRNYRADQVYSVSNNEAWYLIDELGYAKYCKKRVNGKKKRMRPEKRKTKIMRSGPGRGYKTK